MKKLGILTIAALAIFTTSCNSVESRLEGEWDYRILTGGTITESGKAEFTDDGYGKFGEDAFTWTLSESDALTIVDNGASTVMENTENEKDAQNFVFTGLLNIPSTLELTK